MEKTAKKKIGVLLLIAFFGLCWVRAVSGSQEVVQKKARMTTSNMTEFAGSRFLATNANAGQTAKRETGFDKPVLRFDKDSGLIFRGELPGKVSSISPFPDQHVILQGGDDIGNALHIASVPYSDNGTTIGYTNNYDEACPYSGSTSPDVVYGYTPSADDYLDISLCENTAFDSKLYVYAGSYTPGNPYACNDDYCETPSFAGPYVSRIAAMPVSAGITYYIIIDGYDGAAGTYTIDVTSVPEPPEPPTNDNCVDITPEALTAGSTLTYNGNNENATNDCDLFDWPQVWFAFTTTEVLNVTIDFCGTTPAFSFVGAVLTDCPCSDVTQTSLADIACDDENLAVFFNDLPAGTWYYPVYSPEGSQHDFTININGKVPPPPATNDDCANARYIGEVTDLGFNSNSATHDGNGVCTVVFAPNIWYIYTPSFTGYALIDLCGSTYDTQLSVYDGISCDPLPTPLACNDNYCGLSSGVRIPVTMGNPYLIEVGGSSPGYGDLTIAQTTPPTPPANDNCIDVTPDVLTAGATLTYNGNNEDATNDCGSFDWPQVWFAFTTTEVLNVTIDFCGTAPEFEVVTNLLTTCPCSDFTDFSWGSFTICGDNNGTMGFDYLPAGTWYYPVYSGPRSQGDYTIHISGITPPEPPENDNCGDITPVPLAIGAPVQFVGDNTGATMDCNSLGDYEVWHAVTTTECMDISIDLCGTDPAFRNAFITITDQCPCNDEFNYSTEYDTLSCGDGNWTIRYTRIPAGTWYIPVLSEPGSRGPYTLNVRGTACQPLPPADFSVTAPGSWTGNTCRALNNCYLQPSEDVIYEISIPQAGSWIFSLCNSAQNWNSYIFLGSSPCGDDVGSNNGYCDRHSLILANISAGTYYLTIEAIYACGEYQLDVFEAPANPCVDSYYSVEPDWVSTLPAVRRPDLDLYLVDDFILTEDITITGVSFECLHTQFADFANATDLIVLEGSTGAPTETLFIATDLPVTTIMTGESVIGLPKYIHAVEGLNLSLQAGTYFIGFRLVDNGSEGVYYLSSAPVVNSECYVYSAAFGMENWAPISTLFGESVDMAICLFGSHIPQGCQYIVGDANNSHTFTGLDVTYSVRFFKGGPHPPFSCECTAGNTWYVAGDVNGSCSFTGLDITYMVRYFKGGAAPIPCPSCPPTSVILGNPTLRPSVPTIGVETKMLK
jgi:hypothetical protein